MKSHLTLKNIRSSFINIESLEIRKGELLVLVGVSGAGKTSLLNIISGFISHHGTIMLGQRSIETLPSNRRKIGYLFQDLYLFPHLTVYQNLKIAMRDQRLSKQALKKEIHRILDLFKLNSLADSYPNQISGGEKQRVAMARAIASKPELFLLDEPFSHLDYKTARYLRYEFKKMQRRLNITTIFVTHNLQEAKELGDRIAVIENGAIKQLGSPTDLWFGNTSANHHFLERPNILEGFIRKSYENGLLEFKWKDESLLIADEGEDVKQLVIWPQDIHIAINRPSEHAINCFKAAIKKISINDHTARLQVQLNQTLLNIIVEADHFLVLDLKLNDQIYILLKLWCLRGKQTDLKLAAN